METNKQKADFAAQEELREQGIEPTEQETPEKFHRQPLSFVRRGDRLTGRRLKAWEDFSPTHVLDLPRLLTDTSVAPEAEFDAEKFMVAPLP